MGRFKKGLFLGGMLGAVLTWMTTTKKGREVREQMLDYAADVYVDLKKKIKASGSWENMTKHEYVQMAKEAVDKYARDNGLADNIKKMMVKLVGSQWTALQAELRKKKR